jgi:hypothetical protein
VFFTVGNHDMELLFPEVQTLVRERLGASDSIRFPGLDLDLGRVRIEHGSQMDPLFAVDGARLFVTPRNEPKMLNLSWATVALLEVAIPLQPMLHHHDRLKPKDVVLELMPEVKELLMGEFWDYWTKRYFRELFDDPLKSVSWTMLKELVRRLASKDVDVEMGDVLQRRMTRSDAYDLYLVGHQPEPGWWSHGRRKVLRTGCMRDEFMVADRGRSQIPINKTWAEIYLRGDHVVRSQLVEHVAPERPANTMPDSIFGVLPAVRARLAARSDTPAIQHAAQDAQEARERGDD